MGHRTLTSNETLDIAQFVRDQRVLARDIPAAKFSRLKELLVSDPGSISVQLTGRLESKKLWLDFSIAGQVSLVCQRCLHPVAYPLELNGKLRVVESVDGLGLGDQREEEWTVDDIEDALISDRPLSLIELVEDEIVLALPMAVTHNECEIVAMGGKSGALSPFAALRLIKVT